MTFLGVDIGTTGCKVVLIDAERTRIAHAYAEYPLITPRPQWAQLNPETVWLAVASCIKQCTQECGTDRPSALAISELGESFVPIDRQGDPLADALVSFDTRSQSEFRLVTDRLQADRIVAITGLEPLPHYALYRWSWWLNHEPEKYARTWKLASLGGFISVKLGVQPVIAASLAGRTLALDRATTDWSDEIVAGSGLEVAKLPEVMAPGSIAGRVSSESSSRLGMAPGAVVVIGGLDQACAAAGVGVVHPGQAMLSLGTVAAIGAVVSVGTPAGVPWVSHVVPPHQLALAGSPGGGSVLRWYRDVLGAREAIVASETGADVFDVITSTARDHQTDLVFHPHLGGSRFAFSDPQARGAVQGITFATSRQDLVRALLEGVAYELALIRERLERYGIDIQMLVATGGGSLSSVWLQIIADTLNLAIESTGSRDAAAYGAALVAAAATSSATRPTALGTGDWNLPTQQIFEPRPEWTDYHKQGLHRYVEQFRGLRSNEMPPLSTGRLAHRRAGPRSSPSHRRR